MINTIHKTAKQLNSYFEPVIGLLSPQHRSSGIKARVLGIREESADMYTLTLKPSALSTFSFVPGQHIPVHVEINGRTYQRFFSISSSLQMLQKESKIELSIKRVSDGKVTNWLPKQLKKGMSLRIGLAQGTFSVANTQRQQTNAFIACGSGITPILSILESYPSEDLAKQSLLYSVSKKTNAPFIKRLQLLAANGLNLRVLESSSEGRINENIINAWLNNTQVSNLFSCGPSGLAALTEELLNKRASALSHDRPNCYSEFFGFHSVTTSAEHNISFQRKNADSIDAQQLGGTLLESAESAGLKPVYGCRAGICHQCVAKKTSGRVRNLVTNTVSEAGEEDIQLCICVAETDIELTINERSVQ